MKTAILVLCASGILATACGGPSREAAIESFVEEGYTTESADCIMDQIEEAGFSADDVADPIDPGVQPVIETAVPDCIRDADLPGILQVGSLADVEAELVNQLVGSGVFTVDQARCVLDGVRQRGLGLVDINGMRTSAESQATLVEVTTGCLA